MFHCTFKCAKKCQKETRSLTYRSIAERFKLPRPKISINFEAIVKLLFQYTDKTNIVDCGTKEIEMHIAELTVLFFCINMKFC